VGGGAAGLAALESLAKAGVDVRLVEASHRLGGRVYSDSGLELGAQWVHGEEGNSLYSLAEKLNALPDDGDEFSVSDGEAVTLWDSGEEMEQEMVDHLECLFSNLEEKLKKEEHVGKQFSSQGHFFAHHLALELEKQGLVGSSKEKAALAYLGWYGRLQAIIDGAPSWWDTRADMNQEYKECAGNLTISLREGASMQTLIESLANGLQDRISLGMKVTKIRKKDNGFEVVAGNEIINCKYVIVTLSLGVLKHESNKLFEPPLPRSKLEVIEHFEMGTVAKVFLEFPENVFHLFPRLTSSGFNFLRRREQQAGEDCPAWRNDGKDSWEEAVCGLYPQRSHPNLLVAWLTGQAAAQVEQLTEDELISGMQNLLSTFFNRTFPHLVSARVTSWGKDPLTRGSYSFLSNRSLPCSSARLAEPVGALLFAGEATHSSYFGTVHGALDSGRREAERILGWGVTK